MTYTTIEAAAAICVALRSGALPMFAILRETGMPSDAVSQALSVMQDRGYVERGRINGVRACWALTGDAITPRCEWEAV